MDKRSIWHRQAASVVANLDARGVLDTLRSQ